MSRSVILRIRNVSDKICKENQNSHFQYFILSKICCLWHNVEKIL